MFDPAPSQPLPPPAPDLARVFRAEICAARLEAALRADGDLGALWRAQAALQEACASAWLEDLPVSPGDLMGRNFRAQVGDPDRDRAALSATALLRGLHSPGALERDPLAVLERAWSLGGGEGEAPFTAADAQAARRALDAADSPILGALAVARIVAAAVEGRAPAVERLAFVAADHGLRGSGRFMLGEAEPHGLVAAPRGVWVLQPSLALVDNGFRLWSVTRAETVEDLIDGLTRTLERGLGALPMLRRWLDLVRQIRAQAHGASRMPDLIAFLLRRPIITSAAVAEGLGITQRGAQKLIDQSVEREMISKITPRSTYRAWAVTPLARVLGS